MKRCPECRRDYYDDSLAYCLDDGTPLLQGPAHLDLAASNDEPVTAMMPSAVSAPSVRSDGPISGRVDVSSRSIAVLPFAHLSSDPDDEFFCDGLAEELLNALAK